MDQKTLREKAIERAKVSYSVELLESKTTDGDLIYLAVHPELEECIAQGETPEEALANLDEVRIDYFEHLLEFNLPIPRPKVTETKDTSALSAVELPAVTFPGFEDRVDEPRIIFAVAPSA